MATKYQPTTKIDPKTVAKNRDRMAKTHVKAGAPASSGIHDGTAGRIVVSLLIGTMMFFLGRLMIRTYEVGQRKDVAQTNLNIYNFSLRDPQRLSTEMAPTAPLDFFYADEMKRSLTAFFNQQADKEKRAISTGQTLSWEAKDGARGFLICTQGTDNRDCAEFKYESFDAEGRRLSNDGYRLRICP
jgi:hypothetical protein